mmetsp:Transcript_93009/g.299367  ORF Transcript_93009/g.299367 Transcript_93009/m.299367 type:complete len:210 (+) Transcript_93009:249-878(+)
MSKSSKSRQSWVPKNTSFQASMSSAVTRKFRNCFFSQSFACAMAFETLMREACALKSCGCSPSPSQFLADSSKTGKPCRMKARARESWMTCNMLCGSERIRAKRTCPLKLDTPLQVSFMGWSSRGPPRRCGSRHRLHDKPLQPSPFAPAARRSATERSGSFARAPHTSRSADLCPRTSQIFRPAQAHLGPVKALRASGAELNTETKQHA